MSGTGADNAAELTQLKAEGLGAMHVCVSDAVGKHITSKRSSYRRKNRKFNIGSITTYKQCLGLGRWLWFGYGGDISLCGL